MILKIPKHMFHKAFKKALIINWLKLNKISSSGLCRKFLNLTYLHFYYICKSFF